MTEHETIWLQPWCDKCSASGEDRLWCQDNVWYPCGLCKRKPVKYVIARKPRKPIETATNGVVVSGSGEPNG